MLPVLPGLVINCADEKGNKRLLLHYPAQAVTQTAPDTGLCSQQKGQARIPGMRGDRGSHVADWGHGGDAADTLQKPTGRCDPGPKRENTPRFTDWKPSGMISVEFCHPSLGNLGSKPSPEEQTTKND